MDIRVIIGWIITVAAISMVTSLFVPSKYKWFAPLFAVITNSVLSTIVAVYALIMGTQLGSLLMPHHLGEMVIMVDGLSAWFIIIINFTVLNGLIYGSGYLKSYSHLEINLQIHWIFYILLHTSLLLVTMFDSGLPFLFVWEMMSLATMMLLLFEYQHKETLRAGLNFMVQMHICVLFLIVGFILLYVTVGECSFTALAKLTKSNYALLIVVLLIVGFAIKAGFIPFHTWLPVAHPAAPSRVSGVMSGVIVKMGIYGIFRVVANIHFDQMIIGEILVVVSILTAIYGIANAAVVSDYKRMLAFCTIENIGIIGVGVGVGLIGVGINNSTLIALGYGAALLHTLNHALFKSLLFFGAGSIYQQTHTRNIEKLGGLIKKMPVTAIFFLVGALAIGGLPPFNGFISEFVLYFGLFEGFSFYASTSYVVALLLTIMALAFVGGLSLLTFTKTFGVIFLGNSRSDVHHEPKKAPFVMHLPQYFILIVMLSIAIFPQFYFQYAVKVVASIVPTSSVDLPVTSRVADNLVLIGHTSLLFMGLVVLLLGARWLFVRNRKIVKQETWGCAYSRPVVKAQYSGSSFVRSFGSLFGFVIKKHERSDEDISSSLYPKRFSFTSFYFDVLDEYLVTPATRRLMFLLNYFKFIQNGLIQFYLIYGIGFVLFIFLISALKLI